MSARGPSRKSNRDANQSTSQQNGSGTHLPDADPELQHDDDIHFPRQPRPSATTRSTLSSGKSRRSKKSEASTRAPLDPANVVYSRGRPMKPHETEPFLTIDTLPPEKTFVSEKSTLSGTPRKSQNKELSSKSPVITQFQRMSVYMSPYSRETPGAPRSRVLETILQEDDLFEELMLEGPSVVSGKMSPNKAPKSPTFKPRPTSGSRPNTGTKKEKIDEQQKGAVDQETDAIPAKILKSNTADQQNAKENSLMPNTGTKITFESRPSTGSRPGTGSRFGRAGSGNRQKGMRSLPSRNGRITPANTPFQSPNKLTGPNYHVKSPFKHNISKPDLDGRATCTPSMGLKERTALATHHMNRMVSVAMEKDTQKAKGRLQKGKLKPLYPVAVQGPSIDKCRGIISETRSYGSSPSRTLQRRLQLMNTIPNVHEYLYDRPRTVESVHRTSVASSIDDNFYDEEEDSRLPDEIIYAPQKTGSILEPKTPENTFIPNQDPDETLRSFKPIDSDKSGRVFATEIHAPTVDNVNLPTQSEQVAAVNITLQDDDRISNQNNSNSVIVESSTTEENEEDKQRLGSAQMRGISSSKSVRFADDGSKNPKEIKQITNNNIAMQQKNQGDINNGEENINNDEGNINNPGESINTPEENTDDTVAKKNKQNAGSCKSDEIKEFRKTDKDSDDEGDNDAKKPADAKTKDGGHTYSNSKPNSADTDKPVDKEHNKENDNGEPKDGQVLGDMNNLVTDNTKTGKTKKSTGVKKTHKSRSGVNSRPSSGRASGRASASSDRLHKSKKGESCSKFDRSPASKSHTQKLEVSSVLHGGSVQVGLRPESPSRSPSRSCSPSRQSSFHGRNRVPFVDGNNWFQDVGLHGDDLCEATSTRSKVKFLLENEEPEMETIFMEDGGDVRLKQDTQISFDTLEAELIALRLNIQDDLSNIAVQDNDEIVEENLDTGNSSDSETVVDTDSEDDNSVATETDRVETVCGDYGEILEKYRQQCMDRSEKCGAISALIVTPRDTDSIISSTKNSNKGNNLWHLDTDSTKSDGNTHIPKSQVLSNPVSSDSGHGSVENLSEFSRSASVSVSEIPRLDLGGSTSDLEIDTGRSELSDGSKEEEEKITGNLLEMVCDQLSPLTPKEEKLKRKDEEEDVSKIKLVATTKSLSKPKRNKTTMSTNKSPYPPLCFTINARPPAGYLYYFAYGPNMNPDRFKNYIMREDVRRYWGLLFGFNLIFNKKGTSEEAGGFSNIEFNPLRSVEGCIYKITPQELQILDKCIGYPEHYQHLVLPVWMSNSANPDSLGVAQYCVPALMYIAQNRWTETEKTLDYEYSLSQCIKSADLVTKEYRDSLVAMATQKESQAIETSA